jgi:hypothetical protein
MSSLDVADAAALVPCTVPRLTRTGHSLSSAEPVLRRGTAPFGSNSTRTRNLLCSGFGGARGEKQDRARLVAQVAFALSLLCFQEQREGSRTGALRPTATCDLIRLPEDKSRQGTTGREKSFSGVSLSVSHFYHVKFLFFFYASQF